MIQSIRLQADKLKIVRPASEIVLEWCLRIPWALGWLVGFIWYVIRMIVAAAIVGFKAGRGD